MTKNQKGFIHLFLLLFIVLFLSVGVGFYAYQNGQIKVPSSNTPLGSPPPVTRQVSDGTPTDWKTYTNQELGFSIKFPSFLEIKQTDDSVAEFIDKNSSSIGINSDIKFTIGVNLINRDFNKIYSTPDNTEVSSESHAKGNKFTKIHSRIQDGYKVIDYISEGGPSDNYIVGSIFNKNGDLVDIWTVSNDKDSYRDFKYVFDQILSTFKFLGQSLTGNAQTYTNTAYGYQITYGSQFNIVNLADGNKSSDVPPNANQIYIYNPKNPVYSKRLVDINHLDLLIPPGNGWQQETTKLAGIYVDKYTSSSNFDIYNIVLASGPNGESGLEIYVQKENDEASKIINTLKLTN